MSRSWDFSSRKQATTTPDHQQQPTAAVVVVLVLLQVLGEVVDAVRQQRDLHLRLKPAAPDIC